VFVPLHGAHQAANAAVAVAAAEGFFGRELDPDAVREGFASVEVPGRCEVVRHHPLVVLDGAHNPDALHALALTVDDEFAVVGSRYLVVGALGGRDPERLVRAASAIRPDLVVCVPVGSGVRAGDPEELARAWRATGTAVETASSVDGGIDRVRSVALDEDLVVVAGSFRLLDDARRAFARD
jgi:dihydrofolate synthase/folylpolyglutamate synthase